MPVSTDKPVTFPAPSAQDTDDEFPTFNSELDEVDFGEDWGLGEKEDFAADHAPPPVAGSRHAKRKRPKASATRPQAKRTFDWKQLDLTKLREARFYVAGGAALLLIGWGLWRVLGGGGASGDAAAHVVESSPLPEGIEWPSGKFVAVDPAQLRSTNAQPAEPGWFDRLPAEQVVSMGADGKPAKSWTPFAAQAPRLNIERRFADDVPIASNATHYILAQYWADRTRPLGRNERTHDGQLFSRRYEWKTGQPVEPGQSLGRGERKQDWNFPWNRPTLHPAALSEDGGVFAAAAFPRNQRLSVFHFDSQQKEQVDLGEKSAQIRWLGFDAEGALIVQREGQVLGLSKVDFKPQWKVDDEKIQFVEFSPGRDWLAIATRDWIDLHESASGRKLARLAYSCERTIADLAISPDGLQLAAAYIPVAEDVSAGRSPDYETHLLFWNLETGAAWRRLCGIGQGWSPQHVVSSTMRTRQLFWQSPTTLVVVGLHYSLGLLQGTRDHWCVLNITPATLASSESPVVALFENKGLPYFCGPEGDMWLNHGTTEVFAYYPIIPLAPDVPEHRPFPALDAEPEAGEATVPKIRVEVDAGSEQASRTRGLTIADYLIGEGLSIGDGGVTLRVRVGIEDSGDRFDIEGAPWNRTAIPHGVVLYRLFDAAGKEIWSRTEYESWPKGSSRYAMTTQEAQEQGLKVTNMYRPGERREYWDFSGGDPYRLMAEEIREKAGNPELLRSMLDVLRGGGEFQVVGELKAALQTLEEAIAATSEPQQKLPLSQQQEQEVLAIVEKYRSDPSLSSEHRVGLGFLRDDVTTQATVPHALEMLKRAPPPPEEDPRPARIWIAHPRQPDFQ